MKNNKPDQGKVFKEYRKIATVKAKLFERGDEDGMTSSSFVGDMPYVSTLENKMLFGVFGQYYLCIGVEEEKWLIEKSIFEKTYEEISSQP